MPVHTSAPQDIPVLFGINHGTRAFDGVFKAVLAHKPILFLGVWREARALLEDLKDVLERGPAGEPFPASAWGFRTIDGRPDLSDEPFLFATRCSWPCGREAAAGYWAGCPEGMVVLVTKKGCPIPYECRGMAWHVGGLGQIRMSWEGARRR